MEKRNQSPLSTVLDGTHNRRDLLKGTGAAGLALAGAPLLSGQALAQDPVNTTMFVWVGSNQGVVPREVREAYIAENPNVAIELLEGTNAETYPRIKASLEMTP